MAPCHSSLSYVVQVTAGICDNLLTCIVRAWDFRGGSPLLVRQLGRGGGLPKGWHMVLVRAPRG